MKNEKSPFIRARRVSDTRLNRNVNDTVLFTKGMKPHFRRRFSTLDARYFVAGAETALTFYPSFSLLVFFISSFPIDYRYPIEDSAKLSGEARASACSFHFAHPVPGISSGFNVRRQGISKVIESSTAIRRVFKAAGQIGLSSSPKIMQNMYH